MNMASRSTLSTFMIMAALLLTGCQERSMHDLEQFVATAHQGRKPSIEPLPTIKPIESFSYSAQAFPDPFDKENLRPRRVVRSAGGVGPDQNRRREPLENYPLDSLTMVGTLFRKGDTRVIIKTPKGAVQTATIGNYIGQNYGRIVDITEEEIRLKEHVLNSAGVWVERDATLKVKR